MCAKPQTSLYCNLYPNRKYKDVLVRCIMLTKYSCGPIKLAKALLFCFETSHQLDVLAQSLASQSKLPAERTQRHMLPSPLPSRPTPETETVHDTVVTDGLNIRGAGFVTSSLARTRAPSPVPSKEKRSPTPNVLIVDDNPINVSTTKLYGHRGSY